MNIHLPAILMFTRGTRFWHTAMWYWKTNGDRWCAKHWQYEYISTSGWEHDGMRYPISRHTQIQQLSDFPVTGRGWSIFFWQMQWLSYPNLVESEKETIQNLGRFWMITRTTVNTKNVTIYERIRFQAHSWAWGSTKLFKSFCHLVGMQ